MQQFTPAPSVPPVDRIQPSDDYQTAPQNVDSAPFDVLAVLFDKLSQDKKPEKRRRRLDGWLNHWREDKGLDLYPVLRLILPQKDTERNMYQLKEKNLARIYMKLIGLGPRDPDAIRLLNWKRPTEKAASSGDFPTVLFEVVSKRSSVIAGTLSIDGLNQALDDLARNAGKSEAQSRSLGHIYNCTTAREQKWIARIILKDMVISVKETTVFSVFHPDAQDLYNACSDLKKVAYELSNPSHRLNDKDKAIQLFKPFAPMLCKRPTKRIEESVREMQGETFIIEEKLDGERIQLHKRGDEYFYCSRKGKDYTYLYGRHVGEGNLTQYIHQAFSPQMQDVILDGEMLVWDPVSERNLPFGSLKTAALDRSKKEHNPRPCFKVFDFLYWNGQPLAQYTTRARKKALRQCLIEVPGRIEFVKEFEGKTAKDVRDNMDIVMTDRGEGLVIKHPEAQYVLNGRNKDWIKVKPEYMDNMGETVDILVVGGNYGNGKRGGGVSTLICAVFDDTRLVEDDDEPKYSSFVRIGSGLSFADYIWLRAKPWKKWDPNSPPSFFQTAAKSHEDKGDVYLEPEDSFIIKVKAAEIVFSDQYHVGYTMRFPRALSIRDDLSIADCLTISELKASLSSVRKRKMDDGDTGIGHKKRKNNAAKATVLPQYRGLNMKDVPRESSLFEGMNFVIVPNVDIAPQDSDEARAAIWKLIHTHGGNVKLSAKLIDAPKMIYDGRTTRINMQQWIKSDRFDIIRSKWVTDCVDSDGLLPLKKKYFFYATSASKASADYRDGNDEDTEDEEDEAPPATSSADVDDELNSNMDSDGSDTEDEVEIPMDPALAVWLSGTGNMNAPPSLAEMEHDSDNDSDNDDVQEDLTDDWVNFLDDPVTDSAEDVKMGEDDTAMEYDQDSIFKHICFYIDSPNNARKNGMVVKAKNEAAIDKDLAVKQSTILANGGRVTDDLDEPKLTHIVVDKRDTSRRKELIKRTAKPKRRHLVESAFIESCIEEETLVNEEDFIPEPSSARVGQVKITGCT